MALQRSKRSMCTLGVSSTCALQCEPCATQSPPPGLQRADTCSHPFPPSLQGKPQGGALLAAMRKRDHLRPALMQCVLAGSASTIKSAAATGGSDGSKEDDGGEGEDEGSASIALQVVLWRADVLVSILELDGGLTVARADPVAGLMLGLGPKALLKRDFRR